VFTIEKYVLGIDAAWTVKNPSGVALLKWFPKSKPELVRAGRSYDEFCNIGKADWQNSIGDSKHNLDFLKIIECCHEKVDLVAFDMPLSPQKITGRRKADDVISREYGNRKVSTHSPSSNRPGDISNNIFKLLTENGFSWACGHIKTPAFIEVFPHVAIIELFDYDKRFPYKVQKRAKYWPKDSCEERSRKIICKLNELRNKIASEATGIEQFLPQLEPTKYYSIKFLKGYEDLLDAVLCALVGCNFLEGKAEPKPPDDLTGVIWVPKKSKEFANPR